MIIAIAHGPALTFAVFCFLAGSRAGLLPPEAHTPRLDRRPPPPAARRTPLERHHAHRRPVTPLALDAAKAGPETILGYPALDQRVTNGPPT